MAPVGMEGALVEFHSLPGELEPNAETRRRAPESLPIDFNGRQGRVLYWDAEEDKYAVHTFDGVVVGAPPDCLRPASFSPADRGGFDAVWPHGTEDAYGFSAIVGESLQAKGYCVVQMFTPPAVRASAAVEAAGRPSFDGIRAEFEAAFLGTSASTECRVWEAAASAEVSDSALAYCDRELTLAGQLLAPLMPEFLGQEVVERSNAIIRLGARSLSEPVSPELNEADIADQIVETFASWVFSRRVCLLYLVETGGGTLSLRPRRTQPRRGEVDALREVALPLQSGRIVIFRHDVMEYAYEPLGKSVALQTWLLEEQQLIEFREFAQPPLAYGLEQIQVQGIDERFPANCEGCDMTWALFCSGTDAETPVPIMRFDADLYWEPDRDAIIRGKAYIMHGSFVSNEYVIGFDNHHFGIDDEEAWTMAPSQRWVMEVGYSCLYKAGWRWDALNGQRIGTFMGDSGSEWNSIPMHVSKWNIEKNCNFITVTRLAHTLGLTGPNISVDTACSASLVATNAACHLMRTWTHRPGGKEPFTTREKAPLDKALCMGVLVMVHPAGWIGECGATMLSYRGRCFTFDTSADGFIRGEGCCAVYLQTERDAERQMGTRPLAVVLGTCANQDGRSASLTAPHGPSQQECIRRCLREAGLRPQDVLVGECHGTGTALGDPIEVGAVRGVMMHNREESPHTHVSAKAHVGHEEANAGVCGLIKIVLMCNSTLISPNPHLRALNAHLDVNGYPVMFNTELRSTQAAHQIMGVSSFGFGGTNSRAEIWSDADKGSAKTGFRTLLSREEALGWIRKAMGAVDQGMDGFLLDDHKGGH